MKSIFPAAIASDGDLLKLVHLSNSFRMVEGATPLYVGDICRPEARIVSVTNSSEGKIVKVKGQCYRNNQPVIEVVSPTMRTPSTLLRSLITSFIWKVMLMLESCNQRPGNGLSGMIVCHHCFWRVLPLFSAFNLRSLSRIATFPASASLRLVISESFRLVPSRNQLKVLVKVGSADSGTTTASAA
jgi:hypothetical protein